MQLIKFVAKRQGRKIIPCPELTEVIGEIPDDPHIDDALVDILTNRFIKWQAEQNAQQADNS